MSLSKKARGITTEKHLKGPHGWRITVSAEGAGFRIFAHPPRGENPIACVFVETQESGPVQHAVEDMRKLMLARKPDSAAAGEVLDGLK